MSATDSYRVTYRWEPDADVWSAEIAGLNGVNSYGPTLTAARAGARATIAAISGVAAANIDIDEEIEAPAGSVTYESRTSRSLTRVLIGAGLTGWDLLQEQVRFWEAETSRALAAQDAAGRPALPPAPETAGDDGAEPPIDSPIDSRDALLGAVFAIEGNLANAAHWTSERVGGLSRTGARMLDSIAGTSLLGPIRTAAESVQSGIDDRLHDLASLGRSEERRSRQIIDTALGMMTKSSVDTIVQNPEVRALVRDQSTGIATEVAETVRRRTAGADHLVERVARRLTGRRAREELIEDEHPVAAADLVEISPGTPSGG